MSNIHNHLTLHQLNLKIKQELAHSFGMPIWVVAEISELNSNRSGHCYLELIEKSDTGDQIIAKTRATIWAFTFRMLKPYLETTTGQALTRGLKVMVKASVEYHEVFGMSLNITDIDPTYTLGDMARRRREIIEALEADGIAGMNKELDLPPVLQRIAIISSSSAAGYEDFVNQIESHSPNYKIYLKLFPAIMQGNDAEESIISAMEQVYEYDDFFDAVAIIRGGGSSTDLLCFDSYNLAVNVAQFPIPVLTGIGHERDESVVDMVAHTRLKTPTAVAAFILKSVDDFYGYLVQLQEQTMAGATSFIDGHKHHLDTMPHILKSTVDRVINRNSNYLAKALMRMQNGIVQMLSVRHQRVERLKERSRYLALSYLEDRKNNLNKLVIDVSSAQRQYFKTHKQKLDMLEKTSALLNPMQILKKGYTITSVNGAKVTSATQLSAGDVVTTHFADGNVKSRVISN